jgi:hypothetical protein
LILHRAYSDSIDKETDMGKDPTPPTTHSTSAVHWHEVNGNREDLRAWLEKEQPHLLRSYDPILVRAVEQRQQHRRALTSLQSKAAVAAFIALERSCLRQPHGPGVRRTVAHPLAEPARRTSSAQVSHHGVLSCDCAQPFRACTITYTLVDHALCLSS